MDRLVVSAVMRSKAVHTSCQNCQQLDRGVTVAVSCRLDGVLEIKDQAKRLGMEDIIVTTLVAMLEWRKHNNKVSSCFCHLLSQVLQLIRPSKLSTKCRVLCITILPDLLWLSAQNLSPIFIGNNTPSNSDCKECYSRVITPMVLAGVDCSSCHCLRGKVEEAVPLLAARA